MYRHKIELVTYKDIEKFVSIAKDSAGYVRLIDGTGFCVNGKSLLGAIATIEWAELYCESEEDLYPQIEPFVK